VDAGKLSFPLQLLVLVVTTALSGALAVYGTQWGLKSDLRDVATRMEMRDEKHQEKIEALQKEMAELRKGVSMAVTVVNEMRVALAERGIRIQTKEN
jgi:hypothetical protein